MLSNYIVVIESWYEPEYGHSYGHKTEYGISFNIKKSKETIRDLYKGYVCRSETPYYMKLDKYSQYDRCASIIEVTFKEPDYEL